MPFPRTRTLHLMQFSFMYLQFPQVLGCSVTARAEQEAGWCRLYKYPDESSLWFCCYSPLASKLYIYNRIYIYICTYAHALDGQKRSMTGWIWQDLLLLTSASMFYPKFQRVSFPGSLGPLSLSGLFEAAERHRLLMERLVRHTLEMEWRWWELFEWLVGFPKNEKNPPLPILATKNGDTKMKKSLI